MYVPECEAREYALQIIDIITLRPEMELCYLGIGGKCFEVLETRASGQDAGFDGDFGGGDGGGSGEDDEESVEGDDSADDDDGDADQDEEAEGGDTETEEEDVGGDEDDSDCGVERESGVRLRLREILFYDDKVAIFKARHGRI